MNVASTLSLLVLLSSLSANAYIQSGELKKPSLDAELKKASKLHLLIPYDESAVKNGLASMKKRNVKKFSQELSEPVINPENWQSYLYEVRDGRPNIDRLKLLATYELYKAVEKNWADLRSTILNDVAAPNWKNFEPYLRHILSNVEYVPNPKAKGLYAFRVGSWGIVNIREKNKKIVRVGWNIDVGSNYDDNKLEPGAEGITVKQDPRE
jgi:hypothetical protein